ncbi:hypothetical protein RSOLAG1IB_01213 [Rhizoctonia solani AG-1 IB]|uniref:Uncharacterized protein n=1 Tax=Thanatephorus cucumeris (strain AG1-IB / isolate 7/3/14) TaxID=1108050 RepID=A0A0B7FCB8_THACB|nr:hypothetical protein RSOLAG1IB_01213 [Rhizoctonia solani AG-1 IB]
MFGRRCSYKASLPSVVQCSFPADTTSASLGVGNGCADRIIWRAGIPIRKIKLLFEPKPPATSEFRSLAS